jgi:Polyglycine hydrolase-like, structural repeat
MNLAMRHRNGAPPFTKDDAQAIPFFERACGLRMTDGCSNAAEAYREGRGVEKSAARAAEFTRRARELPGGDARPADAATAAPAETTPVEDDDGGWLPPAKYQRAFNRRRSRGFYPAKVEGRVNNGRDEFRAQWKPWSDPCQWASFHAMSKLAFDQHTARYAAQGFTLSSTAQFVDASGSTKYQGTWTKNCAPTPSR